MAQGIIPRAMLESLLETIRITEDVDVLRETTEWAVQQLLEADVADQIGADKYERAGDRRVTQRNGYRHRSLETRVGTIELGIRSYERDRIIRTGFWNGRSLPSRLS